MKIGDKVRIIKRLPGNRTGGFEGWNNEYDHIGLIGVITDESASGNFKVKKGNDYLGYFKSGVEIELILDVEIDCTEGEEKNHYEIY